MESGASFSMRKKEVIKSTILSSALQVARTENHRHIVSNVTGKQIENKLLERRTFIWKHFLSMDVLTVMYLMKIIISRFSKFDILVTTQ